VDHELIDIPEHLCSLTVFGIVRFSQSLILQHYVIQFVSDLREVGFSPVTPVSFTNECHDITEILLKVALNTITLTVTNSLCNTDA
jgi:hypothetical protein